MTPSPVTSIHKNDVFTWRYRDEKLHSDYLNYWCCSRTAIATETHIVDTFWSDGQGARGTFTHAEALKRCELILLGNLNDYEPMPSHEEIFYRPEDVLDLRNSNRSGRNLIKRKKGARRDREVMIELAKRAVRHHEAEAESARRDAARVSAQLLKLISGEDIEQIYLDYPKETWL